MKKLIITLLAIPIFFFQQQSHAGFISLVSYKNNQDKTISVIGEEHCPIETDPNSRNIQVDAEHKRTLFSTIHTLAMQQKPIKLLIEAHKEVNKNYLEKNKEIFSKYYKSTFFELPEFADENNYSYQKIDFIPFDLRSDSIRIPVQFLTLYKESHNVASQGLIPVHDPQNIIHKIVMRNLSSATVAHYLDELDKIKQKAEKTSVSEKINMNAQMAIEFLNKYAQSNDQKVRDIFWEVVQNNNLNQDEISWVQPLSSAIGDASLEIALQSNLEEHSDIMIWGGYAHTQKVAELAQQSDYEIKEIIGLSPEFDLQKFREGTHFCKTDEVQSFLNQLTHKQTCENCDETSSKHCVRCKAAKYCSANCQKENWNHHKQFCKKIVESQK